LRGDQILTLNIKRDVVILPEVSSKQIDVQTGLLTINYFKEGTATIVEKKLGELKNLKKLIIDLRGNGGGTFNDAVKVAEIFLPKGHVIARTISRGVREEYKASGGEQWQPEAQIVVLTDCNTASSSELLTAALKDGRHAMTIGETTKGKWNVQMVEELPNKFAIKYSVSKVETADGQSYEGTGMKADIEMAGPKGAMLGEAQKESDIAKRVKMDAPLKAAIEVGLRRG
jgi:carboxyl-terminal processing protease